MANQPQPNPEQNVPMQFPLAGIDSSDPIAVQRPLTTRDAKNVRSIEPLTQRARGGQRCGLSKLIGQALPLP